MHYEIIGRYFKVFFIKIQLKSEKLEKCFLGARVWTPKLVYQSPKLPEYITVVLKELVSVINLRFVVILEWDNAADISVCVCVCVCVCVFSPC